MINLQNKVLPVALGAALLGGTVGALVMRGKAEQPETRVAAANLLPASQTAGSQAAALRYNDATAVPVAANNEATPVALNSENQPTDESCYRAGFTDGFEAARKEANLGEQSVARSAAPQRVVYRNAPAARRARSSRSARTVYYDYQQPRKRSFWSKHRDKLTVAGGAGVGALIGGLTGGKKGALIGAGVGGGGAAVYTYGIRKRNRY